MRVLRLPHVHTFANMIVFNDHMCVCACNFALHIHLTYRALNENVVCVCVVYFGIVPNSQFA